MGRLLKPDSEPRPKPAASDLQRVRLGNLHFSELPGMVLTHGQGWAPLIRTSRRAVVVVGWVWASAY